MLGAILFFYGNVIIPFIFGNEYSPSVIALQVLIIGHIVNVFTGPSDLLMYMTGNQKQAAYCVGIAAIVNICLNLVLIPKYGVLGACLATVSSTIIWNLLLVIYCRKALGIDTSVLGMKLKTP